MVSHAHPAVRPGSLHDAKCGQMRVCFLPAKSDQCGGVEKAPLTRGVGGFMARKVGGESEGIVLYPSRSPSFGWKPTPLAPLVRGVKAMRPTMGFSTASKREELLRL